MEEVRRIGDVVSVLRDGRLTLSQSLDDVTDGQLIEAMIGRPLSATTMRDRSLGEVVADAQRNVEAEVHLPTGYRMQWTGAFENQQRAVKRLAVVVPITIVIIFFLLFMGMAVSAWHADSQAFNNLMETVKALAMVAAGYWIGSSNSNQRKDETVAAATAALAVSTPPQPIPAQPAA